MPQTPLTNITEQQPKINPKLLFVAVIAILAISSIYLYINSNYLPSIANKSPVQNSTTIPPFKNYSASALINSSNVLFNIPNSDLFVQSYSEQLSPPPNLGISTAYGMNFTNEIINYSSPASPFGYNLSIPSTYLYANSPLAVTVVLWKSKDINNSTSRYLGFLRDSLAESYNYTHHLNILHYGNKRGTINYSVVNVYYLSNNTIVNVTGSDSNSLSGYLSGFLIPYSNSMNTAAAPSFSTEIFPVYKNFKQKSGFIVLFC